MTNWITRKILNFIGPQVCVGAIIKKNGKVLLTKRSSVLIEGNKWCLPGGHLDKGETAEGGVKREIFEETGLRATKVRFLFYHDEFVSPLSLHSLLLIFLVDVTGEPKANWEVSSMRWMKRDEALKEDLAFTHKDILSKFFAMENIR